jgi:hypothetical protein
MLTDFDEGGPRPLEDAPQALGTALGSVAPKEDVEKCAQGEYERGP